MNKQEGVNAISQSLSVLPTAMANTILQQVRHLTDYEPVIGIMGKTGVGKSSLCNALFQGDVSPVSDVSACTREALYFRLKVGERGMTIVDLPGVGESQQRDSEYTQLYQQVLPRLDLVLWVIKADDRALAVDEHFYRHVVGEPYHCKVLFVVSQVDKLEPSQEWDVLTHQPSIQQQTNLARKLDDIRQVFSPPHPVCTLSVKARWGLESMVETLMQCLPRQATSPLTAQLRPPYRTEKVIEQARTDFGESVGGMMDSVISAPFLPMAVKTLVNGIRHTVVSIARAVWDFFF
jgi:hypothetical protein